MASGIEYINIKNYIDGLSTTENPTATDKGIVSNPTNGPRAVPASPDALTTTATEEDLVAGSSIEIKTAEGLKKLPGNAIAPKSVQDKIIESIAPVFDETLAYAVGRFVMYGGSCYRFTAFKAAGAWDATKVEETNLADFVFHGNIADLSYTTFEECKREGLYYIASVDASVITDKPSGVGNDTMVLTVKKANAANNLQVLEFISGIKRIFKRYSPAGSSGTPSSWTDCTPQEVFHGNLVTSLSYTTLEQCKQQGFYYSTASDVGSVTDLPSSVIGVGICLTVKKVNKTYNLQILETLDYRIFKRRSPAGSSETPSDWVDLTPVELRYTKTKFIALGDSITQGFYYDTDDAELKVTTKNWAYYVARFNDYDYTNRGCGGSGYVNVGTVSPNKNAVGIVNDIDFGDYDLVTLAWGVNDWHWNRPIGDLSTSTLNDGTMVGNMRYCIEKILTDNPSIKIVIVGPFNVSTYGGDFNSNWGLGYAFSQSGTLQNVIDKLQSVATFYGLQYIDNLNNNLVNRFNINDVLSDGIHPKELFYERIARSMAKQIAFV